MTETNEKRPLFQRATRDAVATAEEDHEEEEWKDVVDHGSSNDNGKKNGNDNDNDTKNNKDLKSVTRLHHERLPRYSTERYYMLGELETKAHSTKFLAEYRTDDDNNNDNNKLSDPRTNVGGESMSFPPFAILYIPWRSATTTTSSSITSDPNSFVHTVILPLVQQLDHLMTTSTAANKGSTRSPKNIYLVLDRVDASSETDETTKDGEMDVVYKQELELMEALARSVASNGFIRESCQGCTIGWSNHVRAAPGLDACCAAVALGASDRRRQRQQRRQRQFQTMAANEDDSSHRSSIGIVTDYADDLLGNVNNNSNSSDGSDMEPDAVQDVQQRRIAVQWDDGETGLQSFAQRAHADWKRRHGWNDDDKNKDASSPRFLSPDDLPLAVLLFAYAVFHFGGDAREALSWLVGK